MDRKIITNSSEETRAEGTEFAHSLKPGDIVLLYGDLGAGKTTFTQAVAEGLGIKERILSPTFVLQRSHDVNVSSIRNFNHIDLYRIEKPAEVRGLGLSEIFEEEESVTFIEWADKLSDLLPKRGYKIWFNSLGENKREIKFSAI